MADPEKQLDALVSDIAECAYICEDAVVALVTVRVASMHSHVAMPVTTEYYIQKTSGW